jgi:hypothetical protein
MSSKTPTRTIASALGLSNGPVTTVATKVRQALTKDGWRVVKANKLERLETVLNEIYVDNRRQRQVELLDEARKLAQSL